MEYPKHEYDFWIVPDLAIVPHRTYLIYRKNERSKPIGLIVCNDENYETKAIPDLLLSEELALFDACEKFYKERYRNAW